MRHGWVAPNMRVLRTRSSPSVLGSPLTRHPLGGIMHFSVNEAKHKAEKGHIMNGLPIHLIILRRFGRPVVGAVALGAAGGAILVAQESRSIEQDRAGIERLHQQDMAATFSDKAEELANLWDSDAVRIQPGRPAEVGKAVIYANDKRWEASKGKQKTLCGHMEIQDLQIAGDWAFEWAYFSYKEKTAEGNVSTSQGKVLRVLHRQVDGSWKFARVMNFTEKLPSAAPVSHPCE